MQTNRANITEAPLERCVNQIETFRR